MPPELQSQFIDWLLGDADTELQTQRAWCQFHGINERTVRDWKKDPRFRAEWERRAAQKNVSPERMQNVLDTLYRVATEQGDVAAAKLYIEQVNRLLPPKKIEDEGDYAALSDEELVAALQRELAGG